jgi:nucleoside-diphosphate-sugar epimerase
MLAQNYNTSFVDVRDVALAASAALRRSEAGGRRFIVTGDEGPMNTLELGPLAQASLPHLVVGGVPKYSPWQVWLLARLRLVGLFEESQFTRLFRFSNASLKETLGVHPRPLKQTVRETAEVMLQHGWAKAKARVATREAT